MTSTGMSESSMAEFMSALLTLIFASAILDPLRVACCALSQSHSGLPRAGRRRMIGGKRDSVPCRARKETSGAEKMAGVGGVPMDQREGWIWFDGKLVPWQDAKIHVLTHGLHYASSVFEGQRAYGGEVFKLHQHSERLIFSGSLLDMPIPYSADQLDAAARQVLEANKLADAYMRPFRRAITRCTSRSPPGSGRAISRRKNGKKASA
jgi:hypothetical protein